MKFDVNELKWTREPAGYTFAEDRIEIITKPHTDLWQRTYYCCAPLSLTFNGFDCLSRN